MIITMILAAVTAIALAFYIVIISVGVRQGDHRDLGATPCGFAAFLARRVTGLHVVPNPFVPVPERYTLTAGTRCSRPRDEPPPEAYANPQLSHRMPGDGTPLVNSVRSARGQYPQKQTLVSLQSVRTVGRSYRGLGTAAKRRCG